MEEEVRQLITQAVETPERLTDLFKKHFGAEHGLDLDMMNPIHKAHTPLDFNS